MPTGKVISFKNSEGYGWIERDDGGKDLFVHHTNLVMDGFRTLETGQSVEFTVGIGPKDKPEAQQVRVIEHAEARRA